MTAEQAVRESLDRMKPDETEIARRVAVMDAVLGTMPVFRPGVTRQQIDDEMYDERGLPR